MMAYLAMMTARLVELRRVLKNTGSIYLHCDPTASHYLKVLMDSIFGPAMFRNEIEWERSQTRSSISRRFRRAHDTLLFYVKTDQYVFNIQYKALSKASLDLYAQEDERGKYQAVPLLVSGRRNGETGQPWHGIDPNNRGKEGMHWVTRPSKLDDYEKQGLIVWPEKVNGVPRLKYYLEGNPGVPLNDMWHDVDWMGSSSKESLGYQTQKPVALLERIIGASSNPGGTVLDPFCGCGTAIDAAQRLGRRWIGIDITYLAVSLMKSRLHDSYGDTLTYQVIGEPVAVEDAQELARDDPYQFQWWALGLADARPVDQRKGADSGIDGRLAFPDGTAGGTNQVIFSVKAGHTSVAHVRDLRGVIDREKAAIGVLISMEESTQPMRTEAATAGYYEWPFNGERFPRLQLLTVGELLDGRSVQMPPTGQVGMSVKRAPARRKDAVSQPQLQMVAEEPAEYLPEHDEGLEEIPF